MSSYGELDISKIYDNESSKSSMYGLNENADNFSDKNDSRSKTERSIEAGNGWCNYTQRRFFFQVCIYDLEN
jgi:hypothetical protein